MFKVVGQQSFKFLVGISIDIGRVSKPEVVQLSMSSCLFTRTQTCPESVRTTVGSECTRADPSHRGTIQSTQTSMAYIEPTSGLR